MPDEVIDQTTTDQTVQPSETETKVTEKTGVTDTQVKVAETDEQKNERVQREATEKAEKRARGVQKRIDELTAEKHAERKRADELQATLLRMMERGEKAQQADQGEPKQKEGEAWEEYVLRLAEYRADKRVEARLAEFSKKNEEKTQQSTAQQQQAEVERQYLTRQRETAKSIPDFMETMENADIEVPGYTYALIQRMADGPLIAYHLAKNQELTQQFFDSAPEMHGILLGQLSATLKASQKTSNAPAPGTPVKSKPGSSNEPPSDPEKYWDWAQKNMR
jgi:hypothetical protein